MDSILTSIKKLLGIEEEVTHFDKDIIFLINSAFATLAQFIGGSEPTFFEITNAAATWTDYMDDSVALMLIKKYVYMSTKLSFDPPATAAFLESLTAQIKEYEFRIQVETELPTPVTISPEV